MGVGGLVVVGFSFGCMNLSFGSKTEVVTPEASAASEGLQRGKAYVPNGQEVCVYYPVPYVSPPNLEFEDGDGKRHLQIVDQKPDHVRIKNLGGLGSEVPWKARGVLVPTAKTAGAPQSTPPAVENERVMTQHRAP